MARRQRASLPRLPKLHAARGALPKLPALPKPPRTGATPPIVLPPAPWRKGSAWEYWLYLRLLKLSPYWTVQRRLGRPQMPGSSTADFVNDFIRAVIFLDGSYWHDHKQAQDELIAASWRSRGYRVARWRFVSFTDMTKRWLDLYRQNFGA